MKRIGKRYKYESSRISFEMASNIGDIVANLQLYKHELEVILPETVNKSLDELKEEIISDITAAYNVSARRIRNAVMTRKAKLSSPAGSLLVGGKHIPLYEFDPAPKTRYKKLSDRPSVGISALIGRKEARTMFAGSFISDMPKRGIGVYKRVGRYAGQVTRLSGPSVPQMAIATIEGVEFEANAHRRFYENLQNTLNSGHQPRAGFGEK